MRYAGSRYNVFVTTSGNGMGVFNCAQGGFLRISSPLCQFVKELFSPEPFDADDLPQESRTLISESVRGGFLVQEGTDELALLKQRFDAEATDRSFSLTLAPTLECNLRCPYCYQPRIQGRMSRSTCDALVAEVDRRLQDEPCKSLDVDWYGGEPLLALDTIEYLSSKLIDVASKRGIPYAASIVTNGILLDQRAVSTLADCRVRHMQVTLDGPRRVHDRNRPLAGDGSSFDAVIAGLKIAAPHFPIVLRVNVDDNTLPFASEVIDILRRHELLGVTTGVRPYLAMIGPLTEKCAYLCPSPDAMPHFYQAALDFEREVFAALQDPNAMEVLSLPKVLHRACGAQDKLGMCVDPSGRVYRCGLEIHEPHRSCGFLWDEYMRHANYTRWQEFSPFERQACRDCLYLALCMGGCLKHNFEKGQFYEHEACTYWATCLETMLRRLADPTGATA